MLSQVEHLFPSTIHPMVVHFTIAIVYLAGLTGLVSLIYRRSDFFVKAFWFLIVLSFMATIAAGAAGVISESYLTHSTSGAHHILHEHKQDGVLTGVFVTIALVLQSWKCYRTKPRMLPSWIAVLAMLCAVLFVSLAGHLGGTAVYHFGVGVTP